MGGSGAFDSKTLSCAFVASLTDADGIDARIGHEVKTVKLQLSLLCGGICTPRQCANSLGTLSSVVIRDNQLGRLGKTQPSL